MTIEFGPIVLFCLGLVPTSNQVVVFPAFGAAYQDDEPPEVAINRTRKKILCRQKFGGQ